MTEAVPNLFPALPEIVLAIGALALLMIGVFSGAGATRVVNTLAVLLLVRRAGGVVRSNSKRGEHSRAGSYSTRSRAC